MFGLHTLFTSAIVLSPCLAVCTALQKPFFSPSFASSVPKAIFTEHLRSRIAKVLEEHQVKGYSVGVLRLSRENDEISDGDSMEFAQWGNRTESGDPVTENTIIGIGSVTKAFTSAALGLVIHDFATGQNITSLPANVRELSWDTKMKDILPEDWKLMDGWANAQASIRDVLAHVTGMPRHDYALFRNDTSVAAIRRMRYLRPAFELREEWHYNNFGYALAQAIIERYTQQSLPDFLTARVLKPLNMTSTSFTRTDAEATGHASEAFDQHYRRIPHSFHEADMPLVAGMGGLLSSAPDVLRWARLLLGGDGKESKEAIIPRAVLDECLSAQVLLPRHASGNARVTYGFGWFQDEIGGVKRVYHAGNIRGVSALLTLLPDQGVAIVQLANADFKDTANDLIALDIMRALQLVPDGLNLEELASSSPNHAETLTLMAPPSLASSPDLARFAGTYSDAGYGKWTICAPPRATSSSLQSSTRCTEVLQAYSTLENVTAVSSAKLYGYLARPVKTGLEYFTLTLLPMEDDHSPIAPDEETTIAFELQLTQVFPEGFGADTRPFEYGASPGTGLRAVFSLRSGNVSGYGLFGLVGHELPRQKGGKNVQERAEVWMVTTLRGARQPDASYLISEYGFKI